MKIGFQRIMVWNSFRIRSYGGMMWKWYCIFRCIKTRQDFTLFEILPSRHLVLSIWNVMCAGKNRSVKVLTGLEEVQLEEPEF